MASSTYRGQTGSSRPNVWLLAGVGVLGGFSSDIERRNFACGRGALSAFIYISALHKRLLVKKLDVRTFHEVLLHGLI